MTELQAIKEAALKFYVGQDLNEKKILPLWDRTLRIVRNCENFLALPEVMKSDVAVERLALIAAAYFVEANLKSDDCNFAMPNSKKDAEHCEKSAKICKATLKDILPNVKLEKIGKIIADSHNKRSLIPEAQLIYEAISLEEIGIIGMINEIRNYQSSHKAISELLISWQRKEQYGYWDAIISESFSTASTKRIAQKRLNFAKTFIKALRDEHEALDLTGLEI